MDKHGIEHIILSLTSPGPQGRADKADAEDLATRANDVSTRPIILLLNTQLTILNSTLQQNVLRIRHVSPPMLQYQCTILYVDVLET